jgi:Na+/H+-dicarboxylate symporter
MNSTPVAAATAGPMSLPTRPKPFYRVLYIQVLIAIVLGMAIVLGIDKFMSECRALTNVAGDGVAAIVVSAWEDELNHKMLNQTLRHPASDSDVRTAERTE